MSYKGITLDDGTDTLMTLPVDDDTNYSSFASIPTKSGMYRVTYLNSSDADAPETSTMNAWWTVMQISEYDGKRLTQIAVNVFGHDNKLFKRVRHDNTWYSWSKYSPITATTGMVTTPSISANSGAVISLSSVWPSSYDSIIAVFVTGYWPKNTWSSYLMWNAPNYTDKNIYVQNVGSTANSYDITVRIVYTK